MYRDASNKFLAKRLKKREREKEKIKRDEKKRKRNVLSIIPVL